MSLHAIVPKAPLVTKDETDPKKRSVDRKVRLKNKKPLVITTEREKRSPENQGNQKSKRKK